MMVEGVPWILLLPIALMFLVWGVQNSKTSLAELAPRTKKSKKSKKS